MVAYDCFIGALRPSFDFVFDIGDDFNGFLICALAQFHGIARGIERFLTSVCQRKEFFFADSLRFSFVSFSSTRCFEISAIGMRSLWLR